MYRSLEKELKKWKDNPNRYPLLIRGARQVGKTYLVEKFGRAEFTSSVSVNFEAQPEAIACFETFNPEEILLKLQLVVKEPIVPGKTLLFLDEIQACPRAIQALRYFKEKMPQLHVIGAGSLLEFAIVQGKFSFPVGRVQFLYLKPLSFEEYVLARGKSLEGVHEEMMPLVREYFLVGGMPAVVSSFCGTQNLEEVRNIQEVLLSTYQADFSKYASVGEQKYLKIFFEGIFQEIAQHLKYSKIDPDIRSRELKVALNHYRFSEAPSKRPMKIVHKQFHVTCPVAERKREQHVWKCWNETNRKLKAVLAALSRASPDPLKAIRMIEETLLKGVGESPTGESLIKLLG